MKANEVEVTFRTVHLLFFFLDAAKKITLGKLS